MPKHDKRKIEPGLPAADWEKLFRTAGVEAERLDSANKKGKQTLIGNFLARNVGREVAVEVDGRQGRVRLCVAARRGNRKLYYFEVMWDEQEGTAASEGLESLAAEQSDRCGAESLRGKTSPDKKRTSKVTKGTASKKKVRRARSESGSGNSEDW